MRISDYHRKIKFIGLLLIVLMTFINSAFSAKITYPSGEASFTGGAAYCPNDPATALTFTITTCQLGNGPSPSITVTWYSNTLNQTSGGTPVSTIPSTALTTVYNYTPPTDVVGTLYYYVVVTWTPTASGCGSGGTLISSGTQAVIVNDPAPSQPGAISGSTAVSASTPGLIYSISPVATATSYTWTVPTGWSITGGQGTTSLTVTSGLSGQNGDITVTADNSCGSSSARVLAVVVQANDCPVSTSLDIASQTKCQDVAGDLITATITTSGGGGTPTLLYQWYYRNTNSNTVIGATLIGGATSQTYTPPTGATELGGLWYFCVGYATDNGCGQTNADQSLASGTSQVTVNPPAPVQPGAISGTTPVSPSTPGLIYSITAVPNATTYTWTVPTGWSITAGQGTTSLTVTSGLNGQNGDITVTAGNSCGTSTASVKPVTVVANPPTITLGADPSVCQGITTADLTYSATTDNPDLYSINYSGPANAQGFVDVVDAALTASPIVLVVPGGAPVNTYAGTLTVKNSGTGLSSGNYAINVIITDPAPAQPGAITGSATVSASTPGLIYSIGAVATATSYTWTVPVGWSITAGQGTTSLTVTSGLSGQNGNITVTADNSCGSSPASVLAVTVTGPDCPISTGVAPPATQTICTPDPATGLLASITTGGGSGTPTLEYQWYYNTSNSNTVAGATLIGGAINANYTPATGAPELGDRWYFCVGYASDNGCGQSNSTQSQASNTVQVTVNDVPATPGAITGSTPVSPAASGLVYNIAAVPTATSYTWTVPTNWTINSGQGTTSISATSGGVGDNGNITVTATNSCGTSGAQTFAVTVELAAQPPTITLGANPSICKGTTSANLPYTATTESPNQYSVNYNAAAESAGFLDVVNAALPASPIALVVPASAGAPGGISYSAVLTVRNSTSGLSSSGYSISITVNDKPASSGTISGNIAPNENTAMQYVTSSVAGATNYSWTVPGGAWSIDAGDGTNAIDVITGAVGDNGNITVQASNVCGSATSSVLAVTPVTATDHSNYVCNGCHVLHNASGGGLTSTAGNSNLCESCHVTGGSAASVAFDNSMKAIPGVSGNSHSWDVAADNSTYETSPPTTPEMSPYLPSGNIICSTCHDQHDNNVFPYLRADNTGDALCKDCHTARDVGRYTDAPATNKGSHPVGLVYPGGGDYNASPTAPLQTVGGKVECLSCHQMHFAPTSNGTVLRQAGDNSMCTACHTLSTHNGMNCLTCHVVHNTNKNNIYMIRDVIATPNSGNRNVNFSALTSTNSFADGDATYDGICEVCHTTTTHFRNDGSAGDQDHSGTLGSPASGQNCTGCHPHTSNFSPAGGGCAGCHDATPTYLSPVHQKHSTKYACGTCHFNYGSGGSLEPTHPSGTANINFNPTGMAKRNGLDSNTPTWSGTGTKTCGSIYCHSDGRSAYRGTDGTYTWSGTIGSQTATYASPVWTTPITACSSCHSGTGNMTDPYTISTPGLADPLPPATGSHQRGAHTSNSQELSGNGWAAVNCFWCHNTEGGVSSATMYQGTYGTSFHVDGQTYFIPASVVDGGTMVNTSTGTSFSYSFYGSAGHCGAGKTCW